jgi:ABC-type glutathione transport system ATPase component
MPSNDSPMAGPRWPSPTGWPRPAADLILVLEHGRLVQQGTHAGLLAQPGGAYARLHGSWMASLGSTDSPVGA